MFASVSRCVTSFGAGRRPCPGEGFRVVFGQIFGGFSGSAEDEKTGESPGAFMAPRQSLPPAVRVVFGDMG